MSDPNFAINLRLSGDPEYGSNIQILGLDPFILVTLGDVEDNRLDVDIHVGGGVDLDPEQIGFFLGEIAKYLNLAVERGAVDYEDAES